MHPCTACRGNKEASRCHPSAPAGTLFFPAPCTTARCRFQTRAQSASFRKASCGSRQTARAHFSSRTLSSLALCAPLSPTLCRSRRTSGSASAAAKIVCYCLSGRASRCIVLGTRARSRSVPQDGKKGLFAVSSLDLSGPPQRLPSQRWDNYPGRLLGRAQSLTAAMPACRSPVVPGVREPSSE